MVAELLLDKETINHDDLVALIGSRPFKAHKTYLEFISANENAKKEAVEREEAQEGEGGENTSVESRDEEEGGSRAIASREA